MNDKGRKHIVVIEEAFDENEDNKPLGYYRVWADNSMKDVIVNTEGVDGCFNFSKSCFTVYIDKRYDIQFVLSEIESNIVLASGE